MSFFEDQAGGGTPAASLKLRTIGTHFAGTIESFAEVDQKKYNSNEYEVDAAGNRRKQLRIVLQGAPDNYATVSNPLTDENGQVAPDDGRRAVYVPKNTNLSYAIAGALQALGPDMLRRGLEVGGQLAIRYSEDIPTDKGNPARGHEVRYKAPALSTGQWQDQAQPQPVAPQVAQPPAPAYTPPPVQAPQPVAPQPAYTPPPAQAPQPQAAPTTWGQGEPPF